MTQPRLLLIEDDPAMADSMVPLLEKLGFIVFHVDRGDTGLAKALADPFDVVLTDVWVPGIDGMEVARRLRKERARLPVVVMTSRGTTETAIEAMKLGAYDYILKPFGQAEVRGILDAAVEASRTMNDPVVLGPDIHDGSAMIGRSRTMQSVYKEIGRLAARPVSVLIRGETGTGKELVARAIYQHSDRSKEPFVPVDCSSIPETLLESGLFGHEKGAFTGADVRRIGRFEQANGGTLFLDEIGDLTPGTQVKLLRFLQERTFQRVGGRETINADVRILAATHRHLETQISKGEFREDLYYRLAVAVVHLPPLRDRKEDIPELVAYFGRRHGPDLGSPNPTFLPGAMEQLAAHPWPGNVRELENVVRKSILRAQGYPVSREQVEIVLAAALKAVVMPGMATAEKSLRDLASGLLAEAEAGTIDDSRTRLLALADAELIRQAMDRAGGNQAKAARLLGVARLTLREKLKQLGLHGDSISGESGGDP